MQLSKSKIELQAAIGIGERYWIATFILTVIIIACVAVIVNRQMKADDCWSSHSNCIEHFAKLRGLFQEKDDHARTSKKQTDQFLNRTFYNEVQAIKRADNCEVYLREIENSTRQLVQDVKNFAAEKEKAAGKYNLCTEQLNACKGKKTS